VGEDEQEPYRCRVWLESNKGKGGLVMKMVGFWGLTVVTLLAFGLAGYGGVAFSKQPQAETVSFAIDRQSGQPAEY
jgi:hypothetical protein